MGKRKRSNSRELQYLRKKMRKLEKKLESRSNRESASRSPTPTRERDPSRSPSPADADRSSMAPSPMHEDDNITVNQPESNENNDKTEVEAELDTSILELLGNDPSLDNKYGDNLHKEIIPRWKHILTHGLDKEQKTELNKQYLPPENCSNLRAPKLNLEIKAALSELNLKKETFSENKQNQLSSCLAAIGKALNLALCPNEKETSMKDLIKPLSDAGRLLCDYHYRESQSRRYAIINVLNKDIRDTVKNTKVDEFLFGSDLAEQLKSAKAITKSGSELKAARPPYKPPASGQVQRGALNLRGARGAASTTRPFPPRRPPAAPATATRDRDRDHYRHDASSSRRSSQRGRTRRR